MVSLVQDQYQLASNANFQTKQLFNADGSQILADCIFYHADFTVTAEWVTKLDFSNQLENAIKILISEASRLHTTKTDNLESDQSFAGISFSLRDGVEIAGIIPESEGKISGHQIILNIWDAEFKPITYLNEKFGLSISAVESIHYETQYYALYLKNDGRFSAKFLPIEDIGDRFINLFKCFPLMTELEQEQSQLEKFIADYLKESNFLLDKLLKQL